MKKDTKADRIIESLTQIKQILGLMNYRYTSSVNDLDLNDIGTDKFDDARELLINEYDHLVLQLKESVLTTLI